MRRSTSASEVCYYHHKFGNYAKWFRSNFILRFCMRRIRACCDSTKNLTLETSIYEQRTNVKLLIDSGSIVFLLLREVVKEKLKPTDLKFFAAKNTDIRTCGRLLITLNLGLRRSFNWHFIIADVKTDTIRADFLANFSFQIDLKRKFLIDTTTKPAYLYQLQWRKLHPWAMLHTFKGQ